METLSLFDVLEKFHLQCYGAQAHEKRYLALCARYRIHMTVLFDYENYEYIFCDDLKKKFPTWKSVHIEAVGGVNFVSVVSDSVYYAYV